MRTQVAIVGAGPAGLLLAALLAKAGIETRRRRAALGRLRARPDPRRRARAGDRRPARRRRRRRAHARRRPAARRHRALLRRHAPSHRPGRPHRRQAGDGLRPDRGHARPDAAARGAGAGHDLRSRGREPARHRRRPAERSLQPRTAGRARSNATSSPAATATTASAGRASRPSRCALRARLPVRLARRPVGDAAGLARADLLEPRARLRPVQHALGDAQPLLRAVRARRQGRELERRRLLGRAACPARPEGGGRSRHRAVDREEHRAAAQLRRRADALRPPVPRRRRRAHRAADGSQGPEPRRRRRRPARRARWPSTTPTGATPGSTRIRRGACAASGAPSASRGGSRR